MHNKLFLSDNLLLQKITKQHIYCDKKSKDPFTNNTKPKYKLAGNFLLDHYFFHILTTREGACKTLFTILICLSDWENVTPNFKAKLEDVCYCDLTKFEKMNRIILLRKLKDTNNGFPYVGKLCDSKYKELLKLRKRLYRYPYISKETRNFIKVAVSPSIDSILKKLALD